MVHVNPIETDRYGKTIAEVFLGQMFINANMFRKDYAWYNQRGSENCPNRGAIKQVIQETELTGMLP